MTQITPQEAKQLAEEAYIFGFSMLEHYKTMFVQAIYEDAPTYVGGFNQFDHKQALLGPESTFVVGPNNDTLYSFGWLDVGTEPMVLSLPDFDRYFVLQIVDIYTYNVEYIGSRTTGNDAGKWLFVGPDWDGPTPDGIAGVRQTEGRIIALAMRTSVAGV